jgi:hypothetical protein
VSLSLQGSTVKFNSIEVHPLQSIW